MLSEASLTSFAERQSALKKQTKQTIGQIMLTTYHPVVKNVKQTLMQSSSFSTLLIFHSPYSALRIFHRTPRKCAQICKQPIMHIPNSFITSSQGADIAAFFTNLNMKTPYRALLVHFLGVSGSFSYAAPQLDQTPLKNSQRFTLRYKEYGEIRLIASCDRKRKLSNQQCLTFYLKEFIQLNETPCACPQGFCDFAY